MHTAIISFCDRIGFNIKCSYAKDHILQDLEQRHNMRILQKHWYALDDHQFQYVLKLPHAACIRSNGNPYFLYFTRYEGVNQLMYIDKKVQPGYQKPRIILTKGQFHDTLFNNTLLEGEMVKDKHNQWLFLVNDIFMYKGTNLQDQPLPTRLQHGYDLFQNHYHPDPRMDVCQYQIKRFVPISQQHITQLIQFSEQLPYTSRGIYFYPHSLKYKPKLINFNNDLIKSVYRKVKDTPDFIEKAMPPRPPPVPFPPPQTQPKPDHPTSILWLRKTDQPDVYDLFEAENSLKKLGIACVPGFVLSKMLRAIFKDMNVATSVPFHCYYDPTFEKWIPQQKRC
jgi:hypothetical protein